MANTDVSRLLGEMWRNASHDEKVPFVQQELKERAIYKEKIQKFREKQATLDAAKRSSHQLAVTQAYHANQHQLLRPAAQKSYPGIERHASSSPENVAVAVDPFMEDPSNESSAFRPLAPGQYHRSMYLQSDYYSSDAYPQATWSALSMDDDPLPVVPQRHQPHFQTQPPTGEELNPNNNVSYFARGSNYFADPFDQNRFPRYP